MLDLEERNRGVRLVLLVGVALGLGNLAYVLLASPRHIAIDYRVYHLAGTVALEGGNFYTAVPEGLPGYFHYVYPPITVLGFAPLALLGGETVGFAAHTIETVLVGLGAAWLLVRYIERVGGGRLPWLDRGLIGAFVVGSVHSMSSLLFGQVNHHLVAALVVGFVALDADRETLAGVAFGFAAFLKVFPAAVGLWLLRRRAWRAIAAAVGFALAGFAAGLAVFGPELTVAYVERAIVPRFSPDAFAGGLDPEATYLTIRRPISVLLPTVDPTLYGLLAALVLAPPVAYLYRTIEDREDRLVSITGTMAAILVFFPSFPLYFVILYFPLIPLLYLLERGRPRRLLLAGALVASIAIRYDDLETGFEMAGFAPGLLETVVRPVLTFATPGLVGVLVILGGCLLQRRHTHGPQFALRK
ncbi:glycosyltransferase family 87 protein [Halapricum desulfuricans]|uniref:Putative membrane protein n=1 Tax=Halapricum desulfuricans TaxID=2841257 RepID=A0A897MZX9_9EURY|nr:glycosyltransferase family 87 protein [Halapricum desulfuricans]QSG06222.1 putative membrane protein [Halapricum desulfuricans]